MCRVIKRMLDYHIVPIKPYYEQVILDNKERMIHYICRPNIVQPFDTEKINRKIKAVIGFIVRSVDIDPDQIFPYNREDFYAVDCHLFKDSPENYIERYNILRDEGFDVLSFEDRERIKPDGMYLLIDSVGSLTDDFNYMVFYKNKIYKQNIFKNPVYLWEICQA